jgi:hypothetical protein
VSVSSQLSFLLSTLSPRLTKLLSNGYGVGEREGLFHYAKVAGLWCNMHFHAMPKCIELYLPCFLYSCMAIMAKETFTFYLPIM